MSTQEVCNQVSYLEQMNLRGVSEVRNINYLVKTALLLFLTVIAVRPSRWVSYKVSEPHPLSLFIVKDKDCVSFCLRKRLVRFLNG